MARYRTRRVISDDDESDLSSVGDGIGVFAAVRSQAPPKAPKVKVEELSAHEHETSLASAATVTSLDQTSSVITTSQTDTEASSGADTSTPANANMTQGERAGEFEVETPGHENDSKKTSEEKDSGEVTRAGGTMADANSAVPETSITFNDATVQEDCAGIMTKTDGDSSLPSSTVGDAGSRMMSKTSSDIPRGQELTPPSSLEPITIKSSVLAVPSNPRKDTETNMEVDELNATLESGVNQTVMDVDVIEEARQQGPTLAESILKALENVKRVKFKKGDLAIIIEVDDLSKTLLLPSDALGRASDLLRRAARSVADSGKRAEHATDIRFAYLLEADMNASSMPVLSNIDLQQALETFKHTNRRPYAYPLDSDSNLGGEVKNEKGDAAENAAPPIDWIKAYRSFFSVITGTSHHRIFGDDATDALPLIESVIAIARSLCAVPSLEKTFNKMLLYYIDNKTLWAAIAEEAASWLLIALAVEGDSALAYKEALRHLAGLFPTWPWATPQKEIPQNVMAIIDKKSREVRFRRYDIDQELFTLSLQTEAKIKGQRGYIESAYVSQTNEPCIYSTLNLWRDWISEHLACIYHGGEQDFKLPASTLCDHKVRDCLTVAGVYQFIYKGGDAYLPAQNVLSKWNKAGFPNYDEAEVRENLNLLKARAAKVVEPLVASTLQYVDKDKPEYLTCIEVNAEDVPWAKIDQEDDDEMDDMDG